MIAAAELDIFAVYFFGEFLRVTCIVIKADGLL